MYWMEVWQQMDIIGPLLVMRRFARPPPTIHGARPHLSCQRSLTWLSMWWRLLRSWAWCGNASMTAARTGDTSIRWAQERSTARVDGWFQFICICFFVSTLTAGRSPPVLSLIIYSLPPRTHLTFTLLPACSSSINSLGGCGLMTLIFRFFI